MQLYCHQIEDAKFLASRRIAGCFNEAGTGKTLTALCAAELTGIRRLCVIAPPIAVPMWKATIRSFFSQMQVADVSLAHDLPASEGVALVGSYLRTIRYTQHLTHFAGQGPSILICDESHRLKSTDSKTTHAILGTPEDNFSGGIRPLFTHAWFLTGTPIVSWSTDLIPFLFAAAPDVLRQVFGGRLSIPTFQNKFCVRKPVRYRAFGPPIMQVCGSRNAGELRQILNKCATLRKLQEVESELPALKIHHHSVHAQDNSYFQDSSLVEYNPEHMHTCASIGNVTSKHLATLRKELHLQLVDIYSKFILDRYKEIGQPILVGGWHVEVLSRVAEQLRSRGVVVEVITGSTTSKQRVDIQRRFNLKEIPVLLGQMAAMGVSLNLQYGSNQIIILEKDWSPAIISQFIARLHRLHQKYTVHVHILDNDTVIDRAIARILQDKTTYSTQVVKAI